MHIEHGQTAQIISFVMSGGSGSRLWPLSRQDWPKQFHQLSGTGSMLRQTAQRLLARRTHPVLMPEQEPVSGPLYVLGAQAHQYLIETELSGLDLHGGRVLLEPEGRNTAAAVALACLFTLRNYGDRLLLIVPSDHDINTDAQFWQSVEQGIETALQGQIVTFGVKPERAETGYGYIETGAAHDDVFEIHKFIEKPDENSALAYLKNSRFYWNTGIFLFRASVMREAFYHFAADIWDNVTTALDGARADLTATHLPLEAYHKIRSISIDHAIMEHVRNIAMVPAAFGWSDLGTWQGLMTAARQQEMLPSGRQKMHNENPSDVTVSTHEEASSSTLLDMSVSTDAREENGNVLIGDVIAVDCDNSYLRSESGLLSAIGLSHMAVVKTADATFIAPLAQSQNVGKIVARLMLAGRDELCHPVMPVVMTAVGSRSEGGAFSMFAGRSAHDNQTAVQQWLFEQALPLWSTTGVDWHSGGFHEVLSLEGKPLSRVKRTRTMARQIYAFAVAGELGWDGPVDCLIAHGLQFLQSNGRNIHGGWVKTLHADGGANDLTEDCYDQAFMLLALAHAHQAGHAVAYSLAQDTLDFIDRHLSDRSGAGFYNTPTDRDDCSALRHANPSMHLLEAYLAWYRVSGEKQYLQRASVIVSLLRIRFFDAPSWTLGEYYAADWHRPQGIKGEWTEPGHHFEWAALLVTYAQYTGEEDVVRIAHKLYAFAIANGINRKTGLAYNAVSRCGVPIDCNTRSWTQTEALKAAIALNGRGGPDLKPEIEARLETLFRWHLEPAHNGLWIDRIDAQGQAYSKDVPASIFYHLVCALAQYMDYSGMRKGQHESCEGVCARLPYVPILAAE